MLKIGIIGVGHLGRIHLKLAIQSEYYDVVGFFDPSEENSTFAIEQFGAKSFDSFEDLLEKVDVIDIVTPTIYHYEMAEKSLKAGKHTFIEKPISHTVEEAEKLIALKNKYGVKGQIGHVERFNPAFLAIKDKINSPLFIETHRLAEFNPRGTDVPVVLDLMIHDLDIILKIVDSPVVDIKSSGVNVISPTPDIANARIEFENGCVANVTTSRISMKNMRKTRIFQKDAYISLDFLEKKFEYLQMQDAPKNPGDFDIILENNAGEKKQILFHKPEVAANNAILEELESFARSIQNNTTEAVTFEDGKLALEVAYQIINQFRTLDS